MIQGVGLNPVGNNVAAAQRAAALMATRQAQQGVQLTDFTHIEITEGVGGFRVEVMFDVAFTAEPVHKHGMTLPDIRDSEAIAYVTVPNCNSYVQRWITKNGMYVGAIVIIIVRLPESVPVIT